VDNISDGNSVNVPFVWTLLQRRKLGHQTFVTTHSVLPASKNSHRIKIIAHLIDRCLNSYLFDTNFREKLSRKSLCSFIAVNIILSGRNVGTFSLFYCAFSPMFMFWLIVLHSSPIKKTHRSDSQRLKTYSDNCAPFQEGCDYLQPRWKKWDYQKEHGKQFK
jgi:hypothetical protein